jgi:hypothetical protein
MGKLKGLSLSDYTDDVNQLFEFWRFLRVPEALLLAQADVGDIVLCLQKKKFSLSNRLQAIEEICLLIKLDTEDSAFGGGADPSQSELYVLRAGSTKQQAVVLQKWDDFRIYKSVKFSECWYRHLHCERSKQFVDNTQRFIQKIRERPFYKKEESTNQRRLYRSAELIAKYYKNVGILARENQKEVAEATELASVVAGNPKPGGKKPRSGTFEPKDFA